MLMDFAATIAAGAGLAGLVMAIRHFSKGRLPKWIIPAAVGAGMLIFAVWNEYTWYPRVSGVLPESVVILSAPTDRVAYRPWTYLVPVSTRFVALDRGAMATSAENSNFRQADAMIVQRWMRTQRLPIAFDCTTGRSAELVDGATFAPDGTLTGATWVEAGAGDKLIEAACREG